MIPSHPIIPHFRLRVSELKLLACNLPEYTLCYFVLHLTLIHGEDASIVILSRLSFQFSHKSYMQQTNMRYLHEEPTNCAVLGAPVSLEMLGARLETYMSKDTLDTIRLCLQKLPVELILDIVDKIQSDYEDRLRWWKAAYKCFRNKCKCKKNSDPEHCKRQEELIVKVDQSGGVDAFHACQKVRLLAIR